MKKLLALLIIIIGAYTAAAQSGPQINCDTYEGTILGSIECRNFANCGCEKDVLIGTPDLSGFIQFDYIEPNGNWKSENNFSIVYDPVDGTLTLTIENSSGTYTETVDFLPGTAPNFINLLYEGDDLDNFWISGLNVDGFNLDLGNDCYEWTISNLCPEDGYTVTGVINLGGTFLHCISSRIVFAFGVGPYQTDCNVPDDECDPDPDDCEPETIPSTGPICEDCVKFEENDNGTFSPVNDPEVDITAEFETEQNTFTFDVDGLDENCEEVYVQTKSGNKEEGVEVFGPFGNGEHTIENTVKQAISHVTICVFNKDLDGIVSKEEFNSDNMKKETVGSEYLDGDSDRDCNTEAKSLAEASIPEVMPNPANLSTDVKVTVAASQMVTVALYDAYGNKVNDIYQGAMKGGIEYTFTADVSNLAPGMYVINIAGQGFVRQQKIMVVR